MAVDHSEFAVVLAWVANVSAVNLNAVDRVKIEFGGVHFQRLLAELSAGVASEIRRTLYNSHTRGKFYVLARHNQRRKRPGGLRALPNSRGAGAILVNSGCHLS